MTVYSLENALLGVRSERPAINDPTIPRHGSQPPTYICIDTLEIFQDTGSDWLFVGLLGSIDVQGDLTVPHAITAGDWNASPSPDLSTIRGQLYVTDVATNSANDGHVVLIEQEYDPDPVAGAYCALHVIRDGNTSVNDYKSAVVLIDDVTTSAQPIFQVKRGSVSQFQVDSTGVQAPNAALSGPGGATPTLALSKLAGQTGLLIACTDENAAPKVSIAVDGEIVTADDVLAPTGVIKGATVALYASGTGAPSSGTHSQGEFHADTAGALFYCIADGTPGTWKTVTLA